MAQRTNAQMAAFVCEYEAPGSYVLHWCAPGPAEEDTVERLYAFMGEAILRQPGRWWAMDLLPNLAVVNVDPQRSSGE